MRFPFIHAFNYCAKKATLNASKWLWYCLLRNKQRTLHYKENTLSYGGCAYRFALTVLGREVK